MLKNAARAYLNAESSRNPLASPLYGDLRGLPPLLLHASTSELLRDDSVRFAARAVEAGVDARVELWPDAPHCWQLAAALMPQARELIEQAAGFLRAAKDSPENKRGDLAGFPPLPARGERAG